MARRLGKCPRDVGERERSPEIEVHQLLFEFFQIGCIYQPIRKHAFGLVHP